MGVEYVREIVDRLSRRVMHLEVLEGGAGINSYYEPLTNGDAANPELVFAGGDVIMVLIIE